MSERTGRGPDGSVRVFGVDFRRGTVTVFEATRTRPADSGEEAALLGSELVEDTFHVSDQIRL